MANAARLVIGAMQFGEPSTTVTLGTQALSASTTKVGWVFQAEEAATITHVGFPYGLRTGTPPVYKAGIQGTSLTTGLPDGTYKGGGSPASGTFTPPADTTWDATWRWIALANSYTVARGESLSIIVEYSSGTVDGSNNSSITWNVANLGRGARTLFPASCVNTGTWSRSGGTLPLYGYKSSTTVYGNPAKNFSTTTLGTNGNRAALRFMLPSGGGTSFKIGKMRFVGTNPTSADWKFGLWDAAGAMLQDVTLDADYGGAGGLSLLSGQVVFDETTLATLNYGTPYYAGIERTTVTCGLWGVDVDSSNELSALDGGAEFYLATWNGSVWAAQNSRPMVELSLDDITASGGGGAAPFSRIFTGF